MAGLARRPSSLAESDGVFASKPSVMTLFLLASTPHPFVIVAKEWLGLLDALILKAMYAAHVYVALRPPSRSRARSA